jgi:exonuclease SbcD
MAFKILFCTDIHARSVKPASRLDADFMDTVLDKLAHVCEMSKDADMLLLGGDIFDRPDAPNSVIIKVMRTLSLCPVPVFTVIGQHDIYGYQEKSVGTSAMGVLLESGCVRRLDTMNTAGICLRAIHAYDRTSFHADATAKFNILVVHKLITNSNIPGAIPIHEIDNVNKADILLSGDMHEPHNVQVGNKLYLNPGALTRLSIADRKRKPQVALVTINNDYTYEYKLLEVPHKPSEEIFDAAAHEAALASDSRSEDFVKVYASTILSVKAEAYKIGVGLQEFMKTAQTPENIKSMVNRYYEISEKNALEGNKNG